MPGRQWARAKDDPEIFGDALWHILNPATGSTMCDQQPVMPALREEDQHGRECPECLAAPYPTPS